MSKNVSLDWHKNVAMNGQNLSFNLLQKQKKQKLCVVNWTQAISFRVFNRSSTTCCWASIEISTQYLSGKTYLLPRILKLLVPILDTIWPLA